MACLRVVRFRPTSTRSVVVAKPARHYRVSSRNIHSALKTSALAGKVLNRSAHASATRLEMTVLVGQAASRSALLKESTSAYKAWTSNAS